MSTNTNICNHYIIYSRIAKGIIGVNRPNIIKQLSCTYRGKKQSSGKTIILKIE